MSEERKYKGKKKKCWEKKKLKRFLANRNMSYRTLAEKIGISLDAINNKLNGYTEFAGSEMLKIANIFSLDEKQVYEFFISEGCV